MLVAHPGHGIMPVMTMTLPVGEPEAGPWRVEPVSAVIRLLADAAGSPTTGPRIIVVDGRSSSGKTTLAGRLAACDENAHVVHTDDIAWRHSIFGWADLLTEQILRPVRRGQAVTFRPPAWAAHDRPGSIDVPARVSTLIVEGVGVARRELADLTDASVWVQSKLAVLDRRNLARVDAGELPMSAHEQWMAEEVPFLAAQRSWERVTLIVAGTPELPHDPDTELVVAPPMESTSSARHPGSRSRWNSTGRR
jgi:hypothetical protein